MAPRLHPQRGPGLHIAARLSHRPCRLCTFQLLPGLVSSLLLASLAFSAHSAAYSCRWPLRGLEFKVCSLFPFRLFFISVQPSASTFSNTHTCHASKKFLHLLHCHCICESPFHSYSLYVYLVFSRLRVSLRVISYFYVYST